MIPRIELASVELPGGTRLRLVQRGNDFSILLGVSELMNSRISGSEEALARLAIAALRTRKAPRLLIGGLGMGFTLRAALGQLGADAKIAVVELVPAVVDWARGPLATLFAGSLDDRRVETIVGDVGKVIAGAHAAWDAILLDVDNGPEALTQAANDRLYGHAGLGEARTALASGGVLAVWSAHDDAGFTRRLREAGFAVEAHKVRARGDKGAHHVIWIAVAR